MIETIQNKIDGLKSAISELRKNEKLFLKAQGIDEAIEKMRLDLLKSESQIEATKEEIVKLQMRKAAAVSETAKMLSAAMSKVLPAGKAVFNVDDNGNSQIGWLIQGAKISPYEGLSGAEKAQFDVALAYALLADSKCKVLVLEGSEIDSDHLSDFLNHLSDTNPEAQIIVNHWSNPKASLSETWNIIYI